MQRKKPTPPAASASKTSAKGASRANRVVVSSKSETGVPTKPLDAALTSPVKRRWQWGDVTLPVRDGGPGGHIVKPELRKTLEMADSILLSPIGTSKDAVDLAEFVRQHVLALREIEVQHDVAMNELTRRLAVAEGESKQLQSRLDAAETTLWASKREVLRCHVQAKQDAERIEALSSNVQQLELQLATSNSDRDTLKTRCSDLELQAEADSSEARRLEADYIFMKEDRARCYVELQYTRRQAHKEQVKAQDTLRVLSNKDPAAYETTQLLERHRLEIEAMEEAASRQAIKFEQCVCDLESYIEELQEAVNRSHATGLATMSLAKKLDERIAVSEVALKRSGPGAQDRFTSASLYQRVDQLTMRLSLVSAERDQYKRSLEAISSARDVSGLAMPPNSANTSSKSKTSHANKKSRSTAKSREGPGMAKPAASASAESSVLGQAVSEAMRGHIVYQQRVIELMRDGKTFDQATKAASLANSYLGDMEREVKSTGVETPRIASLAALDASPKETPARPYPVTLDASHPDPADSSESLPALSLRMTNEALKSVMKSVYAAGKQMGDTFVQLEIGVAITRNAADDGLFIATGSDLAGKEIDSFRILRSQAIKRLHLIGAGKSIDDGDLILDTIIAEKLSEGLQLLFGRLLLVPGQAGTSAESKPPPPVMTEARKAASFRLVKEATPGSASGQFPGPAMAKTMSDEELVRRETEKLSLSADKVVKLNNQSLARRGSKLAARTASGSDKSETASLAVVPLVASDAKAKGKPQIKPKGGDSSIARSKLVALEASPVKPAVSKPENGKGKGKSGVVTLRKHGSGRALEDMERRKANTLAEAAPSGRRGSLKRNYSDEELVRRAIGLGGGETGLAEKDTTEDQKVSLRRRGSVLADHLETLKVPLARPEVSVTDDAVGEMLEYTENMDMLLSPRSVAPEAYAPSKRRGFAEDSARSSFSQMSMTAEDMGPRVPNSSLVAKRTYSDEELLRRDLTTSLDGLALSRGGSAAWQQQQRRTSLVRRGSVAASTTNMLESFDANQLIAKLKAVEQQRAATVIQAQFRGAAARRELAVVKRSKSTGRSQVAEDIITSSSAARPMAMAEGTGKRRYSDEELLRRSMATSSETIDTVRIEEASMSVITKRNSLVRRGSVLASSSVPLQALTKGEAKPASFKRGIRSNGRYAVVTVARLAPLEGIGSSASLRFTVTVYLTKEHILLSPLTVTAADHDAGASSISTGSFPMRLGRVGSAGCEDFLVAVDIRDREAAWPEAIVTVHKL